MKQARFDLWAFSIAFSISLWPPRFESVCGATAFETLACDPNTEIGTDTPSQASTSGLQLIGAEVRV